MQKKRKYGVEAGLGTYVSYKTLVPVEHLADVGTEDKHPYHIYAILAFDEFYYDRDSINQTSDSIEAVIFTEDDNGRHEYKMPPIRIAKDLDHRKVKIELVYPYTMLRFTITDDEYLNNGENPITQPFILTATDFFQMFGGAVVDKNEYEVLYIGQAYGSDGKRTAIQRLSTHSTLQKILAEAKINYPTKHIYILLMVISQSLNLLFDGTRKEYIMDEKSCDEHLNNVICNLPIEKQVINITEAALINYFKPEYNQRLVNNFPNRNNQSYRQYFDLDYNALTVEMDLEFDRGPLVQLYTKTARLNNIYDYIRYHLYNDDNRLSMFDIFQEE